MAPLPRMFSFTCPYAAFLLSFILPWFLVTLTAFRRLGDGCTLPPQGPLASYKWWARWAYRMGHLKTERPTTTKSIGA